MNMNPNAKRNYSYSYKDDDLCFETGYFGLKLSISDLTKVKFGLFNDHYNDLSYFESLVKDASDRMLTQLGDAELILEVSHLKDEGAGPNGNIYSHDAITHRIVSSDNVRLWESGRIAQHYDLKELKFQQVKGNDSIGNNIIDEWDVTLYVMVWPRSVSFTIEIISKDSSRKYFESSPYKYIFLKIKMKGLQRSQLFEISSQQRRRESYKTSLMCNFDKSRETMRKKLNIGCSYESPKQGLQTNPSEQFGCYVISSNQLLARSFRGGYTDIRDYDEFYIFLDNESDEDWYVPILLFVQYLANPTGLCPIVCDNNYEPTGIHIQLSKNWHNNQLKNYGRFFSFLPAKAGSRSEYRLRIPYGFYGSLPSASHSNLSLIGYGQQGGRWEQLAIGSCGETYCMDLDMGCVEQIITDIRMLYTKGEDDKLWSWSDAGWGGDWLYISDKSSTRLMPFAFRTAYEAHGPCITSMHVDGSYKNNSGDKVSLSSAVKTLRTDDYARTFTTLKYSFSQDLPTRESYFFSLGSTSCIETPMVVYGNKDGLIEEIDLSNTELEPNEYLIDRKELRGSPPWFVGFPRQEQRDARKWGKGFRALIITNYCASLNNKVYTNPSISLIGYRKIPQIKSNVRLAIVPPAGVDRLMEGDEISLEVYVTTFPKKVTDYYGTNEDFRRNLTLYQDSWKIVHREAAQNDLDVNVVGGILKSKYPIVVNATSQESIIVSVRGGVGMIPLKFEGLESKEYLLKLQGENGEYEIFTDQEIHGKDYWQTDFDESSSYSMSFNVPTSETKKLKSWQLQHC